MMVTAFAPAKINRELRVGAVRPDGFHEILSRFASIELADRLSAELLPEGIAFSCDDPTLPQDDGNLVVRAAKILRAHLGTAAGASLKLDKRIPSGAGLGGGSADAAVALRLLCLLWQKELPADELTQLAARLGSDVPFFLTGGEADVRGRGEIVAGREDPPLVDLLVVVPPFAIATGAVYDAYRRQHAGRGVLPGSLEIDSSGRFFGPNDLTPAILEVCPEMKELLTGARAAAAEATITGSGSAIILLHPAENALSLLAGMFPPSRFYRTRTLGRREYIARLQC